jgi:collagen type II alpha
MAKQATCIQPKPSVSAEMAVETTERELWFSEIPDGGFQFTYKADSNQISFLQLLSSVANQVTFTFT